MYTSICTLPTIKANTTTTTRRRTTIMITTTITITIKKKTKQPQGPPWSLSRDFLIQSLIFPLFPRILIQYIPIFVHANKCNQKQKDK